MMPSARTSGPSCDAGSMDSTSASGTAAANLAVYMGSRPPGRPLTHMIRGRQPLRGSEAGTPEIGSGTHPTLWYGIPCLQPGLVGIFVIIEGSAGECDQAWEPTVKID
jgi:hypothetical protein